MNGGVRGPILATLVIAALSSSPAARAATALAPATVSRIGRIGRTSILPTHAGGISCRELDRLIEIPGLDHVEAGKLFLGLGEGPIGDRHLAVAHAHGRRRADRLQCLRGETVAARPDRRVVGDAVFVGQFVEATFVKIDETQVFHCLPPLLSCLRVCMFV